jgi:hypothetical protein
MYHDFYENLGIFSVVFPGCIVCGKYKGITEPLDEGIAKTA